MRFGLFGGARTEIGEQASDSRIYTDYIDYICDAEALGFHSLFLVEHHFTGFGQISATLNFLTYLAAKTTTLRLGTAVLVLPWHNPALLAEQAATLDLLSNGRFDLGVGKGYRWGEFHGFCMPMAEAEERYRETLAFLRKAWTTDGRFSHHGKYWHYEDIVVEPAPVQKPHPPFWIGAASPNSIRAAAAQGHHPPHQAAAGRRCRIRDGDRLRRLARPPAHLRPRGDAGVRRGLGIEPQNLGRSGWGSRPAWTCSRPSSAQRCNCGNTLPGFSNP